MGPNLRFGVFLATGAFFLLGPIETQVFLGPARSVKRPYLPMRWQMYHSVGVGFCQAQLYTQRDGVRVAYAQDELSRAIGRGTARGGKRRFNVGKKARAYDVTFSNESELAEIVPSLCKGEPGADVRAEMRCSPPLPGGKWRMVEDGSINLCERTKWRPGAPSEPSAVDAETGEPIEPEPSE